MKKEKKKKEKRKVGGFFPVNLLNQYNQFYSVVVVKWFT